MTFGSLFSGIGAPECAWEPLGWRCAWQAEIDPFASAVLAQRFPGVPNLGDVNGVSADAIEPVDLVVFGSPCQSFSVAGKRLGMDDPRGNMALIGLRLVGRIRPRWVVFENVPGLLSSDEGRDFGTILRALGQCGYGFAYRVLDAQNFGVPQRRRRVFVVGYLGDWRPAAAVLFEPESLLGHPAPRRETGQGTARPIAGCAPGGSGYRNDADTADNLSIHPLRGPSQSSFRAFGLDTQNIGNGGGNVGWRDAEHPCITLNTKGNIGLAFGGNNTSGSVDLATACNAKGGSGRIDFETETLIAHSLRANGFDASEDGTGRGTPLIAWGIIGGAQKGKNHAYRQEVSGAMQHKGLAATGNEAGTLLQRAMQVRRLTPPECEHLQGFPPGWTAITYRGKPAADGNRYRALGNAMCVPVIRWIGSRIAALHHLSVSPRPLTTAAGTSTTLGAVARRAADKAK